MPGTLLDAMKEASGDEAPKDESQYIDDVNYHVTAGVIEQALRDVGALPKPEALRTPKPYDEDIRKLIMNVTVE